MAAPEPAPALQEQHVLEECVREVVLDSAHAADIVDACKSLNLSVASLASGSLDAFDVASMLFIPVKTAKALVSTCKYKLSTAQVPPADNDGLQTGPKPNIVQSRVAEIETSLQEQQRASKSPRPGRYEPPQALKSRPLQHSLSHSEGADCSEQYTGGSLHVSCYCEILTGETKTSDPVTPVQTGRGQSHHRTPRETPSTSGGRESMNSASYSATGKTRIPGTPTTARLSRQIGETCVSVTKIPRPKLALTQGKQGVESTGTKAPSEQTALNGSNISILSRKSDCAPVASKAAADLSRNRSLQLRPSSGGGSASSCDSPKPPTKIRKAASPMSSKTTRETQYTPAINSGCITDRRGKVGKASSFSQLDSDVVVSVRVEGDGGSTSSDNRKGYQSAGTKKKNLFQRAVKSILQAAGSHVVSQQVDAGRGDSVKSRPFAMYSDARAQRNQKRNTLEPEAGPLHVVNTKTSSVLTRIRLLPLMAFQNGHVAGLFVAANGPSTTEALHGNQGTKRLCDAPRLTC